MTPIHENPAEQMGTDSRRWGVNKRKEAEHRRREHHRINPSARLVCVVFCLRRERERDERKSSAVQTCAVLVVPTRRERKEQTAGRDCIRHKTTKGQDKEKPFPPPVR